MRPTPNVVVVGFIAKLMLGRPILCRHTGRDTALVQINAGGVAVMSLDCRARRDGVDLKGRSFREVNIALGEL